MKKSGKVTLIAAGIASIAGGVTGYFLFNKKANSHESIEYNQTSNPNPSIMPENTPSNIAGVSGCTMQFIAANAQANNKISNETYSWMNKGESGSYITIIGIDEQSNLKIYSNFVKSENLVGWAEFTFGRTSSGKSIDQTFQELTKGKDVTYTNDTDRILVETLRDGWSVIDCQVTNDPLIINFYNSTVNTSGNTSMATYMSNFNAVDDYFIAQSFKVNDGKLFQFNINVKADIVKEWTGKEVKFGDETIKLDTQEKAAAYIANVASQGGPEAAHRVDDEGNPELVYSTDLIEIPTTTLDNIIDNVAGSTFVAEK